MHTKSPYEAIVSTRGRITLPPLTREHIGLAPGGCVRFTVHDDGRIILSAQPSNEASSGEEIEK
jgi:AbrB family looped-hinge helix DNA binding protein